MNPNNPQGPGTGRQPRQGDFTQGNAPQRAQQGVPEPMTVEEMTVATPTLRRISMDQPNEQLPVGEDDYVLDSVYNHQIDAWEVLVLVQPPRTDEE